jgi:hypothetical protein
MSLNIFSYTFTDTVPNNVSNWRTVAYCMAIFFIIHAFGFHQHYPFNDVEQELELETELEDAKHKDLYYLSLENTVNNTSSVNTYFQKQHFPHYSFYYLSTLCCELHSPPPEVY